MLQSVYRIVCRFTAIGIKEIPASSLQEAMELARSNDYEFKQIDHIESCTVDEHRSRLIEERGFDQRKPKDYLSWGAE